MTESAAAALMGLECTLQLHEHAAAITNPAWGPGTTSHAAVLPQVPAPPAGAASTSATGAGGGAVRRRAISDMAKITNPTRTDPPAMRATHSLHSDSVNSPAGAKNLSNTTR